MAFSKIILNGTTLMDVTQDTVAAANLLSGETAHKNDGTSVTGNIASKSSSDLTASTLTVTAPAGYYASDATKTLTDQNLTAGNIKKNVAIFGVTGSYEGSGGGGTTTTYVRFYDYDGTLISTKTKDEVNAMTSDSDLPANPTHTGLTSQGWNWTVAQLKAQLTAMPDQDINVGQMYITTSGDTEIDVVMQEGRLEPIMTLAVNGTVSVDWGDNTTPDTVTGTSLTSRKAVGPHTYASAGNYTIKISVTNGEFVFYCSTSYLLLRKDATSNGSRVYADCIKSIRIGSGMTKFGSYALFYCTSLRNITIPSSVTHITSDAFSNCYSLASVTIPNGVTTILSSVFSNCCSLTSVAIPSGVTSIGSNAFYYC